MYPKTNQLATISASGTATSDLFMLHDVSVDEEKQLTRLTLAEALATEHVAHQGAPAGSLDSNQTMTATHLMAGIITSGVGAVSLTLPAGADLDSSWDIDSSYAIDWSLIKTDTVGAATLVAGTNHTIVGSAVVALSTSGSFRTRRSDTNTYITYRLA
jgi:hypothetical protein